MKYEEIIAKLTDEQKLSLAASLKSLADPAFAEAGIPALRYIGPHRANARCGYVLPSYAAMANSWNAGLIYGATAMLAAQAHADGVNFMFTPQLRLRSDPYERGMTEDPYLGDVYAHAAADAIKSCGVLPCLTGCGLGERDTAFLDKEVNPRALHEYFLRPFSSYASGENPAVAAPFTQLGGSYRNVNKNIIGGYLRKSAPNGFVVCTKADKEAGAACLAAGELLWSGDLTLLREAYENFKQLKEAVYRGESSPEELEAACAAGTALDESVLNEAADRAIGLAFLCEQFAANGRAEFPQDLSYAASLESIVLLKNKGVLPLKAGSRVAVIGRIGTPYGATTETMFAETLARGDRCAVIGAAAGYDLAGDRSDDLLDQACLCADGADTVVLFLGTDAQREEKMIVEGKVRLPANQLALLSALRERGKKVIAVLAGGLTTDMSFDAKADALLLAPVDGIRCAEALAAVLTGEVSPSGRLAVTCYDDPDGYFATLRSNKDAGKNKVGVFIGYRNYDTARLKMRYPFGFGLSYTAFEYSRLEVKGNTVSFVVRNTGRCAGSEVAQVYVGKTAPALPRPRRELKAFAKIELKPGESRKISLAVDPASLSVFAGGGYTVEGGEYTVAVGASVSDIRLTGTMQLAGAKLPRSSERMSDYLQTYSNVLSGGYTLGDVKSAGKKGKKLSYTGLTLLFVFAVAAVAIAVLDLVGLLSVWHLGYELLGFGVAVVGAVLGLILFLAGRASRKKAERKAVTVARENTADKTVHPALPYEKLFDDLFAEDRTAEKERSAPKAGADTDALRYYDPSYKLPLACQRLEAFAAERGIVLGARDAMKIFASFSASRLVLVRSKTAAYMPKLLAVLSEFFGTALYADEYTGYAHAQDLLFRAGEEGFAEKTNVARALFDAPSNPRAVHIAALGGVPAEDIAAFFMPFSRYVNYPGEGNTVTLRDSGMAENSFRITPNVWFVFVLKEDTDLLQTDSYIANIASLLDLDVSVTEEAENKREADVFGYYQLLGLARAARDGYALDEDKDWKKIDRLEAYVKKHADFDIDNKSWTRMEKYASVCLACGGEEEDALDCTLAAKLLLPVLIAGGKAEEGVSGVLGAFDAIFGDGNIPESKRIVSALGYTDAA